MLDSFTATRGVSDDDRFGIRVFISYSHTDEENDHAVTKVVSALQKNGITPMWDKDFLYGHGFHDLIKAFISISHVFMPLITKSSSKKGWVHQEIGYATAMNIPILPVILDDEALPAEMIHSLHALKISRVMLDDQEEMERLLSRPIFEALINNFRDGSNSIYTCAEHHEDRTTRMVKYSNEVSRLGYHGFVRQKGGLSSFHIPEVPISHHLWKDRYGLCPKSPSHCKLQREERLALTKHAREAGCRLIVTNGDYLRKHLGEEVFRTRIQSLLDFLRSMPPGKVEIVVVDDLDPAISVTILDDYFAAEAFSGSIIKGYERTLFTRHAPNIRDKMEHFDQEFDDELHHRGWSREGSCRDAISLFEKAFQLSKERSEAMKASSNSNE